MPLATVADYRAAINKTDNGDDAAILSDIAAIGDWLERKLGYRQFRKDASARTRLFDGSDDVLLPIDDCCKPPTIVMVDRGDGGGLRALTTGAWRTRPLNALERSPVRPITALERLGGERWPTRAGIVEVTAMYGWPTVPTAIARAVIQLVAIWRLETPRATAQVAPDLGLTLEMSGIAVDILRDVTAEFGRGQRMGGFG